MNSFVPVSFEFFPPRTPEGFAKWQETRTRLAVACPQYLSVTSGAGGSTRDRTVETVADCLAAGFETAPHLSCIGAQRQEIHDLLARYLSLGVRRIVALRGDMPSGMVDPGDFRYASDLVSFIRAEYGGHFHVEVAAYPETHPQAPHALADLDHFQRKVAAGANGAITQYFYNADAYFQLVAACRQRGMVIPIVPGIMPITNFTQLARFSEACGTEIPRWLRKRLEALGEDLPAIRVLGHDVVLALCRRLLEGGAPGLHFYTMNQAEPILNLLEDLGYPVLTPAASS
ncbi:5,10-methylenetetrahydrofolate reductase [Gammaproteobacteria bacterium]